MSLLINNIFWITFIISIFAFGLSLANQLLLDNGVMIVTILSGINLITHLIWGIIKIFTSKFPHIIFPLQFLIVVILLNVAIRKDSSSILRLNMIPETCERCLTSTLVIFVSTYCYSDYKRTLFWYTPIYLIGYSYLILAKIDWQK